MAWPRMRDGYRYVRQYRSRKTGEWQGWALYEVQGGRARRVGTARTEDGYRAFLAAPKLARLSCLGH